MNLTCRPTQVPRVTGFRTNVAHWATLYFAIGIFNMNVNVLILWKGLNKSCKCLRNENTN